ncbi:MAG: hypothetical protein VXZ53_21195, partial [Planctomycetota bacterium]|nr:hypothetical protein [Planctomycetota bacterium]
MKWRATPSDYFHGQGKSDLVFQRRKLTFVEHQQRHFKIIFQEQHQMTLRVQLVAIITVAKQELTQVTAVQG